MDYGFNATVCHDALSVTGGMSNHHRKKKKKMKELPVETICEEAEEKVYKKVKTPAQLAFDKALEKRVCYSIIITNGLLVVAIAS